MAVVVEADASGRIVIPKNILEELDIKERTKLLLTTTAERLLLVQKLNVEKKRIKLIQLLPSPELLRSARCHA